MAYYLNLDPDGYLLSISAFGDGVHIDTLDGLDLTGDRIGAYRWDGSGLVRDGERLAEITKAAQDITRLEQISELTAQLRESDSTVLEALEGLFSATTATGFIAALVTSARNIRETLSERSELRTRIRELGGGT